MDSAVGFRAAGSKLVEPPVGDAEQAVDGRGHCLVPRLVRRNA
jgi:hypothetical protein